MQANVNVASQFWGFLSIYVYTLCPTSTVFGVVSHGLGRACFVGVGQALPILGILTIFSYTHCCRTTEFDVVTYGGGARILGPATPPIPREQSSSAIFGFRVFAYTE